MHEDKVVLTGDRQDLGPQVRRRLTPISDDFFQPLHPRLVRMHGRMITGHDPQVERQNASEGQSACQRRRRRGGSVTARLTWYFGSSVINSPLLIECHEDGFQT